MALTDARSSESSKEAADDKEASLMARISELETQASSQAENTRRLEEELRRREELLFKTPRKQLEALGNETDDSLTEQISRLAASVLSQNDQLAEKQLSRARSFLEVLRGAAWGREATPSSFKLGKFLDDLSACFEHEAKKAFGSSGMNKTLKGRKGSTATPTEQAGSRDTGRTGLFVSSPAALPAPPGSEPDGKSGTSNSSMLNATNLQEEASTVKLPSTYRRAVPATLPRSGNSTTMDSSAAVGSASLPGKYTGEPVPDAGMPNFASSYSWHSSGLPESKQRVPVPNGTASSSGISATTGGTCSSLNSTEGADDEFLSPSTSAVLLMPPGGVATSAGIYSASDRDRPPGSRGVRSVLEA